MSIEGRSPGERPETVVSRRTLIKTAAGAGIAVAVAGTVGIANAGDTTRHDVSGSPLTTNPTASNAMSASTGGPVVVHVTSAGQLEIYTDGARTEIHDADLASRVSAAAKSSPAVIHVIDPAAGTLEVFGHDSRTQIRDTDLARRIIHAV
jgi:hypothetical protein